VSLEERIAKWLYEEYSDGWWDWGKAPQRKRDFYLMKANELIGACNIGEAPATQAEERHQ
jgi:hypothetical protein